jgi:ABC-type branched-subunit amino acid transport system substrate-binding protein
VVSVLAPASRYFVGVLEMVRATWPAAGRLALAYGGSGTFPQAVIGGAEAYARRHSFEVVASAPYPSDEGGMAALVTEIAARQPDLILGAGTTEADLELARQLRVVGVRSALVGLVAAPIELFGEALGAAAEGFVGPSQWEPGVRQRPDLGPTSAQFVTRFRARFGAEPDYPAAQAYAAGLIAQRCVELAGTLREAALYEVASQLALTTFYGEFKLDPATGEQVGHALLAVQWQDGTRKVVWPAAVAEARPRLPMPSR